MFNIINHLGNANLRQSKIHFTSTGMINIKKSDNYKCGEDVEKLEPWNTAGRNVKQWSHLGKESYNSWND